MAEENGQSVVKTFRI